MELLGRFLLLAVHSAAHHRDQYSECKISQLLQEPTKP